MCVREDEIQYPDRSTGVYSIVEKPDFALVIPFENDGFWLVEQFRYSVGRCWEFPQGTWAPVAVRPRISPSPNSPKRPDSRPTAGST